MSDQGTGINLLEKLQASTATQNQPSMMGPPPGSSITPPPQRTGPLPGPMYPVPYGMPYPPPQMMPSHLMVPNQGFPPVMPQQQPPNMMFSRFPQPPPTMQGPPLSSLGSLNVQNTPLNTPPPLNPITNPPPPSTTSSDNSSNPLSDPAVLRRSSGSITLPINGSAPKNTLLSPSTKKRQMEAPGVILSGTKVTINTDVPVSNNVQELEVQAIAVYSSEYAYHNGSLIAVNKKSICYTVKGDLIRVISRKTASRDLLKGHTHAVTELQFTNDDGDILASGGSDGKILIWKIIEISEKDPITHEILHQINGSVSDSIMRIAWHPTNPNIIVSADKDSVIRVYDRSSLPQQVEKSQSHVSITGNTDITDISFGQDGQLAVAHSDKVTLYDVQTGNSIWTINPHSKPVDSLVFCPSSKSSQLLVTGSNQNCELKLWDISTLKCLQLIQVHSPLSQKQLANHFAFDKTGTYMFLVNSKDKSIYALRVVPGSQDSQPMFDYLTEFSIAYPVLSFMITNHERGNSKPNPSSPISEMQLHCVQTKAIQTYYVNSEQCYSKIGNVTSPAVTEEKLEDAKPVVSNAEPKVQPAPKKAEVSTDQPREPPRPQEKVEVQEKPQEKPVEVLSEPEQKPTPAKPQEAKQDVPERKAEAPEALDPSLLTPSFFKTKKEKEEETAKEIVDQILNNVEQSSSVKEEVPSTPTKEQEPTPKKEETKKKKHRKNKNTEEDGNSATPNQQNKQKGQKAKQDTEQHEKKEPAKIVIKEEPKFELNEIPALSPTGSADLGVAAQIGMMMQYHMDKLYQKLEAERKERERLERERQEKLLEAIAKTLNNNMGQQMEKIIHKELQTVIVPALGKAMVGILENSLLKPLQENFKKIMTQSIAPKLEGIVKESITSKQLGLEVATNIGDSIKQHVHDAFSQYFQNMLIPSFEKSCQALFVQLNHTFEKGLQERAHSGPQTISRNDNSADHMRVAVQALVEATAAMSKTIVDTQNKILNDYVERQGRSTEQHPVDKEASSFQQMTRELIPLINSKKFEEAFSSALSARNVQLITWLCSKMDPHAIFSMRPLPLSQYVLLSLIQQLGFDLTRDTDLKLTWLREAALVLDMSDQVLGEHAPQILAKLLKKLEENYPKYADTSSSASIKLLMHVVNSLLKQ